jgi:hypothetical protein
MRRLLPLLIAGLALATFGCSSSDDAATPTTTAAPSSTTTSSVVVSPANKPTCDAFTEFKKVADGSPDVAEGGDPTANMTKVQEFLGSLIAPMQAVQAVAPAELQPSITTLIENGETLIALDPSTPAAQTQIGEAIMAPSAEVTAAQNEFYGWAATNCGIKIG